MTYTIEQAQADFGRLLKDVEEGKDVVIERDGKPVARLSAVVGQDRPGGKRPLGLYAGQHKYSDDVFKPLETDEELHAYGFGIMTEGKEPDEPAA